MNGRRCNKGNFGGSSSMRTALSLTVAAAGVLGGLAQLTSNPDGCVTDYDAAAGVDYFPDKAVVTYAETFSVEYFPTYKVLSSTDGWVTTTYVLYQCGTPEPTLDETVQAYISVPVTTVATGTPDHIPRIEVLLDSVPLKVCVLVAICYRCAAELSGATTTTVVYLL